MEVMFERLANSTLRSRIAEQLRDAIVDGTLRTGERIVERKLAAQFGASLAVVREAIIQLEAEGFITKWSNTSTPCDSVVVSGNGKDLRGQKGFGSFAAEEAARRASPQEQITDNEYLQSALRRGVVPLFAFSSIRLTSHRSFDLLQDANTHLPLLNAIKSKDPRTAREALLSALTLWRSETVSVAEETSSQK